jgi:archaemetzincin
MAHVGLHVERAFGARVLLVDRAARPVGTHDPRRNQHHSTRMLEWLAREQPGPGKVLGVTDVDLFIPILTFVFGEAQLDGAAAVVSTSRLLEGAALDPRVLIERLAKEAVHELGHAMGLVHCALAACAMSRSASVREVDRKSGALCRDCGSLLRDARVRGGRA